MELYILTVFRFRTLFFEVCSVWCSTMRFSSLTSHAMSMANVLVPMARSGLAGRLRGHAVFFLNSFFERKKTGSPDQGLASALLATGLAPYTMPQDLYGNTGPHIHRI